MKTLIVLAALALPVIVPPSKATAPRRRPVASVASATRAVPKRAPRPRLVIDPGHGGNDDGALGRRTSDEVVALQVALELKRLFDADGRVEVFYTRQDDRFLELDARTAFARRVRADAFVSLHANSVDKKPHIDGIEVWHLSDNRVEKGHQQAAARSRSLAALVERHIMLRTGQGSRGVRQSGFQVLRASEIPSVLVELGFLSNEKEEAMLMTPAWRKKAARAIHGAVIEWMQQTGKLARPRIQA